MKEHPIVLEGSEEEKQHFSKLFNQLLDESHDVSKDIAVPLPNSKRPGYSPVYRNKYAIDHNNGEIIELLDEKLNTAYNFWENAVGLWPNNNCIGERKRRLNPHYEGKLHNEDKTQKYVFDNYYTFQTYKEVDEIKSYIGSGIIELVTNHLRYKPSELKEIYKDYDGKNPDNNTTKFVVSIFSVNRPEWVIADLACQAYSLCTTTLYDNLGPETSRYILNLMKSPIVFTTKDKILNILSLKKKFPKELSKLLIVISFDDLNLIKDDYFFYKFATDVGIDLYDFNNLAKLGKLNPYGLIRPVPSTPYTVCFTSGTTGVSKGVYITHGNMATSMTFAFHHWPRPVKDNQVGVVDADISGRNKNNNTKGGNEEQLKSYCLLPLAHIYERQTTTYSLFSNIAIGFPSGNISTRVEDCSILKPNYLQAVPRIYSRIEQELKAMVNENDFLRNFIDTKFKLLFNNLITDEHKKFRFKTMSEAIEYDHLNMLITNKLRESQGFHKIKFCLSASAPISLITQNFICTVLNIGFIQNYGASEVTSACTGEYPFRLRITKEMVMFDNGKDATDGNRKGNGTKTKEKSIVSCSGPVGVTTDVKLKDLPELGYVYDSKDGKPKGEVLFKGPQVFEKYVYRPDITSASFEDNNTWYRTGDICEIGSDGKLYVIDRIKNFFKLSQGEYLTPERIENIYLSNISFVNQCFVHGYSDQDYIVGIIGIIPIELCKFLKHISKNKKKFFNYNQHINDAELQKIVSAIEQFHRSITQKQTEQAQEIELSNSQKKVLDQFMGLINNNIDLRAVILQEMNNVVANNPNVSLASYEKLNNVYFGFYPLRINTGLLTPTLKLQRPTSIKNYRSIMDRMYEEGSLLKKNKNSNL